MEDSIVLMSFLSLIKVIIILFIFLFIIIINIPLTFDEEVIWEESVDS
mgnify:FL=1